MHFRETCFPEAFVIDVELLQDDRGAFARTFCADIFRERGLNAAVSQCSTSLSTRKGTLRGMHFQQAPHEEVKLVRCTAGAIFDVIVDVRRQSATFGKWFGVELSAANRSAMFVPEGFAHGFVTLADSTEVFYMISTPYVAAAQRGFRWSDPAVGIRWPLQPEVISQRDATYPTLAELMSAA